MPSIPFEVISEMLNRHFHFPGNFGIDRISFPTRHRNVTFFSFSRDFWHTFRYFRLPTPALRSDSHSDRLPLLALTFERIISLTDGFTLLIDRS